VLEFHPPELGDHVTTDQILDQRDAQITRDAVDLKLVDQGRPFIRCVCSALFVSNTAAEVKGMRNHNCPNEAINWPATASFAIAAAALLLVLFLGK
jgi:hypothetical protein